MAQRENVMPQARNLDLVTREVADEVLVYDLKRHKAHCLNQTAALVWKHCDGQNSVADIATLMQGDLSTSVDEATVWLAVERLGKANLLAERITPPAGSPRLSRRDAMRRIGLGAALAVPVVMTVIAPTAVMAATCTPGVTGTVANGGQCTSSLQCQSCCCKSSNTKCDATGPCLAT